MSKNNGRFWKGKKLSDETRKKISENHGCRGKFKELNPNSKKVARIDKDTYEVIQIHNSFKEAEEWVKENIRPTATFTNISKCCNNKVKIAYGFIWRYV